MHKFSKADEKRVAELLSELREQADDIEALWPKLEEVVAEINGAITAYNEKITEANGVIEDIASEVENYTSERSENWADTDRGMAITEWLSELQSCQLEEVEEIEVPEQPTWDHADTLENLPQEASL